MFAGIANVRAQDHANVYLQADLSSAYLWRGQRCGGLSLQPVAGVKWKGLDFFFWGDVPINPPQDRRNEHEIDIFLNYSISRRLSVGFKNVYINTRGKGIFSYGHIPHAANGLDVFFTYDFRHINAEWSTTIAGYDGYNHKGKRAYGSYLTVNAPFSMAHFDWTASLGVVPYYCSRYTDDSSKGFHVNMLSFKMAHAFGFKKKDTSLTPYAMLMVNPSGEKAYFQIGARYLFAPGS